MMLSWLQDLLRDLGHVTVSTRVGPISDAPDEGPATLETDLDLLGGSLSHTRSAAFLTGPVVVLHTQAEEISDTVRRQWPRVIGRFARLDRQLAATPDEDP